ncbi:Aspercryptin biosynthesis cluster-specific transcription regulator atnN [Beauveria bassiana]|nr:Aspercryptin biosynthesis cluster-specific transcription regulator atnN [Beauveria bassiana]
MPSGSGQRIFSRSRTGCRTCRLKKVKCDEARPQCQRCRRLRRFCDYSNQTELVAQDAMQANNHRGGQLILQLPAFSSSVCSISLTAVDHEAIRYFRTTFARRNHTKNPDYSVYSVIFTIAQSEPLVMHTVLALACRAIQPRDEATTIISRRQNWHHLFHYSSALGRLKEELEKSPDSNEAFHFDACFTALYVMLVYEQHFGDDDGFAGLAHHLQGAAMVLRHCGHHIRRDLDAETLATPPLAICQRGGSSERRLSLYSARILIWMSLCDATAATYGIGGSFNAALNEILGSDDPEGIERLHTFSNSLFRVVWGEAYPQAELTDDIENRSVFELTVCCSRARYSLATLARAVNAGDVDAAQACTRATKSLIQYLAARYRELLEVASGLLPCTDHSHRLVANLRGIVPHYHAAVIVFSRLADKVPDSPPVFVDVKPHVDAIMSLARQAYRHQGSDAMVRIAWPLLVVSLETTHQPTRNWIIARFQSMATLGKNMERATDFLRHSVGPSKATGLTAWADPARWFRSTDGTPFII